MADALIGGLKIEQSDSMPAEEDETVTRAAEMHKMILKFNVHSRIIK